MLAKRGKGKEARPSYAGHALMENRRGLVVDFQLTHATGTAEGDMAAKLIDEAREHGFRVRTLGADKSYDSKECVANLRRRGVTPHVAQNTSGRQSAIDGRIARQVGYAITQIKRRRIEIV